MRLVVFTRCGNSLVDDIEDMETTVASLHKSLFEDLVAETVTLDIHLSGCDAVDSTCHLEVHVAEVILVAENITEDGILGAFGVCDETHGNAADGFLHLHACVEKCKSAGAHSSHR